MARKAARSTVPGVTSQRPTRPRATHDATLAAIKAEFPDFEGIQVLERRFTHPDLPGSLPIRLRDEPAHVDDPSGAHRRWYLRWIKGDEPGRFSLITDAMGYVPVRMTELQNPQAVAGMIAKSDDGYVRRGDRGQEILVKIPLKAYTLIKRQQQERRARRANNARLVKADLAARASATSHGGLGSDEAADLIHDEFALTIRKTKTTLGAEANEEAELIDQS